MDGIDFPTPISQIPTEKQNNLAINVYGATVSPNLSLLRYQLDQTQCKKSTSFL